MNVLTYTENLVESIKGYLFLRLVLMVLLLMTISFLVNRTSSWFFKNSHLFPEADSKTIQGVIRSTLKYLIAIILIIYIIGQFIDIKGLLAGAGIIGVILGFAAQQILKDVLLGFTRISDKEFRVGDYVTFNGVISGTVEEIGIRFMQIREWSGKLLTISHGEIRTIENFNKGKMRIIERVTVSYQEEPERIKWLLEEICKICNEKYGETLLRGEDGIPEQDFRYYGITDLNPNLRYIGYEFCMVALVKPENFFETSRNVRFELMSVFHKNLVSMAVSNVLFQSEQGTS
ncbi:mechanosensitive ion channel family protein [Neobacillus vireti]|uniref:mechanosensitive ion channel family protein n=1 Tax=Neobacillus vireti TaxID=220686 RepID=UPI0005528AB0|nr:mechanosensitive ion channel family protein [Neobacillus vireti]KLT16058.1 mechanosensitive ion channel protein [Neobacillus vireti]